MIRHYIPSIPIKWNIIENHKLIATTVWSDDISRVKKFGYAFKMCPIAINILLASTAHGNSLSPVYNNSYLLVKTWKRIGIGQG